MPVKIVKYTSSLSSKGQVTVPLEIRKRLGVKAGDRIEFVVRDGSTVIRPSHDGENPFAKQLGILGPFPGGEEGIKNWISEMRDEQD